MEESKLSVRFGCLIRDLRLSAGLTQESLADLCDLHRTYIGAIERGEKTVTIETANKLAFAFSLSLGQIFVKLDELDEHKSDRKAGGK